MPAITDRDTERIRAGLAASLGSRIPGAADVEIEILEAPERTGYSHETVLFDADYTRDGSPHRLDLVARIEPAEHSVFPDTDLAREHRVRMALAATDVPVPRSLYLEDDPSLVGARFSVMERVDGEIPGDNPPYTMGGFVSEATPAEQERLWWTALEAMATVHTLDHENLDLGPLDTGLDGQLDYWQRYLRWSGPLPLGEAALAWLETNRPTEGPHTLCWGDSRIGNAIFKDFRCVAILDWEMAVVADPVMDLAWFCYFDELFSTGLDAPRPAGFPSREDTVRRWEELTGRQAAALDYYDAFAALRFATILHRLGRLMVSFGRLPEDSDFPENNFATQWLERVLDEKGVRR